MEPFLSLTAPWLVYQEDQPFRKLSGIGKMRHYLHSTKVSMKGRERRHFPEKNEASIHTDQRFHYKICLRREEGRNELRCWSIRPTDGERGTGRPEPTFLASEAVVTGTGTSMGIPLSRKVRREERYADRMLKAAKRCGFVSPA